MSNTQASDSAQAKEKQKDGKKRNIPVLTFVLDVFLKGLGIAIFAGFISVVIEFGLFFYSEQPVQDSYARLEAVTQFKATGSWFNEKRFFDWAQGYFLTELNISQNINSLRYYTDGFAHTLSPVQGQNKYLNIGRAWVSGVVKAIPDLITVWVLATFSWLAKVLSVIAMSFPALLIMIGGFIDGTVTRKIDTFRGIRVSQDKIEWWFLAFKFSSYTMLFLYIAVPNSIEAGMVVLPSAVLSAVFCRNVVANYKKYV